LAAGRTTVNNTPTQVSKPLRLLITVAGEAVIAFPGITSCTPFEKYAFPGTRGHLRDRDRVLLAKSSPRCPSHGGGPGGFLLAADTAFGLRLRRRGDCPISVIVSGDLRLS
jgi:hypothetical protein